MSQTGCKSRRTEIWQNLVIDEATGFHWICFSDLGAWTRSSPSNHALSFYWTVKNFYNSSGNQNRKTFFFTNSQYQLQGFKLKKNILVAATTLPLAFWYKMRRENNQPTRINLLINFNSSREEPVEPGGCISSVRGVQGSIWLETRLMWNSSINFT